MNNNISKENINALKIIMNKIPVRQYDWIIGGSTALAIRGIDVTVNGIDIITDLKNADGIAKTLSKYVIKPMNTIEKNNLRTYQGIFIIEGIKVKLIADIEKFENEKWVKRNYAEIINIKTFEGMNIPLRTLPKEKEFYQSIGDKYKLEKILEYINK